MFEYTNKSGRLTIKEALNGFYIYDNKTGECRGMGSDLFEGANEFDADLRRMIHLSEIQHYLCEEMDFAEDMYLAAYFGIHEQP